MPSKKTNVKQDPGSAGLALHSADAFRALSRPFLDFVGTDMNICHERAVQNMGAMIASATSLALSVELYLKALRLLHGIKASHTHDLLALFDGLPETLRASIDRVYTQIPSNPVGVASSLILGVILGQKKEIPPSVPPKRPPDNSIRAVLERSKDAFQTWRYMHEQGELETSVEFVYEFHNLGRIAEAIRSHIAPSIYTRVGPSPDKARPDSKTPS